MEMIWGNLRSCYAPLPGTQQCRAQDSGIVIQLRQANMGISSGISGIDSLGGFFPKGEQQRISRPADTASDT